MGAQCRANCCPKGCCCKACREGDWGLDEDDVAFAVGSEGQLEEVDPDATSDTFRSALEAEEGRSVDRRRRQTRKPAAKTKTTQPQSTFKTRMLGVFKKAAAQGGNGENMFLKFD